eukprot:c12752_g1_i1.p1 GENE.c12752_g1_i1~~c12752_g1_i1.p1  ORF type:complete len:560 (+),score=241.60 c12752_g1_i1:32-1711(+)
MDFTKLFRRKVMKASKSHLVPVLNLIDLTFVGIGGIIGSGIFVLIGVVALRTGPSVVLSLLIAGIVTLLVALCYAEFASFVPAAGSAYAYTYISMGEFPAWLVGWNLVLEYTVGVAAIARGWAGYSVKLLHTFKPSLNTDWLETPIEGTPFSLSFISPAIIIILTLSSLFGVAESSLANIILCAIKISILFIVISAGFAVADEKNWTEEEYAPEGFEGILGGAATVIFAYFGFDGISTLSEEAINPSRDVPLAIIISCLFSTAVYIFTAAALTLMIPYTSINKNAPLSDAFSQRDMEWVSILIAFGAFTGITSALLVGILSQMRVWLSLAQDGLIPEIFAQVNEKYSTPHMAAIASGIFAAFFAGFLDLEALANLIAIGTLFAFSVVATSLLLLRYNFSLPSIGLLTGVWIASFCLNIVLRIDVPLIISIFFGLVLICFLFPFHFLPEFETGSNFKLPFGPLIPLCSVMANISTMCSLGFTVWIRFFIWIVVGLIIYFFYGIHHSKIDIENNNISSSSRLRLNKDRGDNESHKGLLSENDNNISSSSYQNGTGGQNESE